MVHGRRRNLCVGGEVDTDLEYVIGEPAKCEWSWLDPKCHKPCPIFVPGGIDKQIALVPTDEIQMLGVPLGSDEKAAVYVERKLLHKLSVMVDRFSDFNAICFFPPTHLI